MNNNTEKTHYTYIVVPEEERISLPYITHFELARLISMMVKDLGDTGILRMNADLLHVYTDDIDQKVKKELSNDDIITINGRTAIKLTSTIDIVKVEINSRRSPFLITREMGRDEKEMTIRVEILDVNEMIIPILKTFTNI